MSPSKRKGFTHTHNKASPKESILLEDVPEVVPSPSSSQWPPLTAEGAECLCGSLSAPKVGQNLLGVYFDLLVKLCSPFPGVSESHRGETEC